MSSRWVTLPRVGAVLAIAGMLNGCSSRSSLGNRLKTGVLVTYAGREPLTNLWLTLARQFGSTASTFGSTGDRVLLEVLAQ
jgi:hypothetical protein